MGWRKQLSLVVQVALSQSRNLLEQSFLTRTGLVDGDGGGDGTAGDYGDVFYRRRDGQAALLDGIDKPHALAVQLRLMI